MIFEQEPEGFTPRFAVASCFVECQGKILLLLRQDHKPQPNCWGIPAGKIDAGELPQEALLREVKEETQILLQHPVFCKKIYVRFPEYDFICIKRCLM